MIKCDGLDRAELAHRKEKFDVIIGDLADPVDGGPCYQLYTRSFYENVLKPRLEVGGIFVTQVHSCSESYLLSVLPLSSK